MKKLFILSAVFLFGAAAANAGTPKLLGEYNDWSAFYYQDGKNVVCYMARRHLRRHHPPPGGKKL